MNKLSLAVLAAAAALAIAPAAMATTITPGSSITAIGFNESWDAAGDVAFVGTPGTSGCCGVGYIGGSTGSFSGLSGTAGVYNLVYATPDTLLMYFGADVLTFTITGPVDLIADSGSNYDLIGTGTFAGTGYTTTSGTFSLTLTGSNYQGGGFTLTEVGAATPEPSSLILLGTGLLGLAFVAFRKAKSTGMALSM